MEASVGRTLVKTNGSDGAAGVRLKRNPKLGRPPEPTIKRRRHNRARPDGLLGCGVSGAGQDNSQAQQYCPNISQELCFGNSSAGVSPDPVEMTFRYDHAISLR